MKGLAISERVSHYRILKKLGAGGMGEVYLAQDTLLDRKVAIKFLPPESFADERAKKRLIKEAQTAAKLDHPNICSIYEVAEEDGQSFVVMQYVEGETLASRIQCKSLELREALDVAVQVADALSQAHSRGIIHRDIKPANIMLSAHGQVKVMDFGMAKVIKEKSLIQSEAETESLLSEPGAIVGTVSYMSPEQVRGETLDGRSDIFGFGAVLYEMVSRIQPFAAESAAGIISAILTREPAPLARYSREVPAELERIVSKALQKDREERHQSAKDLMIDLKNLRDELVFEARLERTASPESANLPGVKTASGVAVATASHSETKTESNAEYIVGQITRHKLGAAMVVAALMAVAAVSYYYFSVPDSEAAINSVAVLPFVNESGNADVEYLSDGMTESLINSLSQLPNLLVKARSSVFRYKGKEVESQQVASELSVQAILNGRLVLRGDDLALYLSLVDGRTGNQIWGEQYNRKLADLVSLQKEIALDVSHKLRARLAGADEQKVAKNYTENTEAHELYLKGRYHVYKLIPSGIQTGISHFEQAIRLDPNYALAYAGLSDAYRSLALSGEALPTEFLPKAKVAAQKAIEIDDHLAAAHTTLGVNIFWYDWDWSAAENQYKRALELNPNDADAHLFYAHLLSNTGRHEEALAEVKRARELDPLSPFVNALEGQFLLHAGRTDEALDRLQKTFELEPNFWMVHLFASNAYIEKGRYPEAIAEAHKASQLAAFQTVSVAVESYALAKSGKRDEARALLNELLKLSQKRFVPPYHIAFAYNGLGERDETLAWLARGIEQRDPKMAFLKVEPKWNNLRDDPRFQEVLRRVGFTP